MAIDKIDTFRNMLETVGDLPENAWIYLPETRNWSLDSDSIALESEEVPPELEDEPDAEVPQFAKDNKLMQVVPVATLQDIVSNARAQKPSATLEELFEAFKFYYERDAFIEL